MAQLPPKIPNMAPSWPDIMFAGGHQQKLPIPSTFINGCGGGGGGGGQAPSWVDEFLDFSSARRGSHRRSASDSIAFLDSGPILDGGGNHPSGARSNADDRGDFDRFDDEQFLSMFTDEISPVGPTLTSSNPSTPSDHNSINDEKQVKEKGEQNTQSQQQTTVAVKNSNEAEEVQSPCNSSEGHGAAGTSTAGGNDSGERIVDPKRVKRILANRQSAQRSRVRKLQYISELERSVTSLQSEVSVLSPRVAFLDHQRLLLNIDNSALKQRIAALAQDKIFKDAHQEALKREIDRLRQVYHQQNLQKNNNMENNGNGNSSTPPPVTTSSDRKPPCQAEEQLLAA